ERARFPAALPATGDVAVWVPATAGPRLLPEGRFVAVFVPVRDRSGRLLAGVALEVDARRFFSEVADAGDIPGDVWFALDADGRTMLMPERAAAMLKWPADPQTPTSLAEHANPDRQALARAVLASPRTAGDYFLDGRKNRFASAKVPATGWVFVE